ncbi:MAG TPA: RNA polymerase sigma-70 factor [Chitinophagaceae bacterium]|nr:RNA polymerase sigma-70 factor [Chitinophagaceae bacterium]
MSTPELYSTFEALFKEHYNALANYAFSFLKNKESAEDVVQDVFVKLWQNQPDVVKTSQVKFYLFTAIKNNCISVLRKESGKVFVQPEDVQLSASEEPAHHGPKDIGSLIDKALSTLPPQCLVIFKMSRFGKLTYQQIADELGLSVKTVENQVGKALRIMREHAKQHNISFALLMLVLFPEAHAFMGLA